MTLRHKAISGVKWNGVSMGVITGLQFITLIVLARILSPMDFGVMGMIMVVIGFAQAFADMGLSNAIIHRQDTSPDQLSSLYWLNVLAGVAVFCVICASAPLIVGFYHEPRLQNLLYLTAAIFLITPLGQQFQILLQKELKFEGLAKIGIASAVANSIVAVLLAFSGFGVFSLIWGQLAGAAVKVVLLFKIGRGNWKPRFHYSRQDIKGYASFGLYQMGERTINYFNANLDYLLIGSLLGAKALGYYTLAYNLIIRPASMINPVITTVAFPVFAKMQNDRDALKNGYLKVLQLLSFFNFPLMAGLAVVAPLAVPAVFGDQWLPSVILIQILAIVGLLRSIGNPVGALVLAKGRADLGFKWNLSTLAVQISALYLGIKLGGTTGVAIAFASVMTIYSVFSYLILIRTMLGPCLRGYVMSMWPSLWISGLMMLAVFTTGILLQNVAQLTALIMQICCGVFVFGILVLCSQRAIIAEIKSIIQS